MSEAAFPSVTKTRRPYLTPAQIDEIIRLREGGMKTGRIAQKTGINGATIAYQLLRAGLDPHEKGQNRKRPGTFTAEEDERMLALRRGGMSPGRIGKVMNRAYTSIRQRLLLLEVRAENALESA